LYGAALNSSQLAHLSALSNPYDRGISSHAAALPSSTSQIPATAAPAPACSFSAPSPPSAKAAKSSATGANTSKRKATESLQVQGQKRRNIRRKYTHENFPSRLHRLLCEADAVGHAHICRFTNDGTMFQILDTKSFEAHVLPRYFRHGRIDSFKRLLRMYGWERVEGTWMQGVFKHPMFRRDEPDLCLQMERKEKK